MWEVIANKHKNSNGIVAQAAYVGMVMKIGDNVGYFYGVKLQKGYKSDFLDF